MSGHMSITLSHPHSDGAHDPIMAGQDDAAEDADQQPGVTSYSTVKISGSVGYECVESLLKVVSGFYTAILILALGSFALTMHASIFWLCWCMLVTEAVTVYCLRPYWTGDITKSENQPSEQLIIHRFASTAEGVVMYLKIGLSSALIVALAFNKPFRRREYTTLLFSTIFLRIFLEGYPTFYLRRRYAKKVAAMDEGKDRIKEVKEWIITATKLGPSVVNTMVAVTGGIIFGSRLAVLLKDKVFCMVGYAILMDILTELIHRFDRLRGFEIREIFTVSRRRYAVVFFLRSCVLSFVCFWILIAILRKDYLRDVGYYDENSTCYGKCRGRSSSLVIGVVVLGFLQAIWPLLAWIVNWFVVHMAWNEAVLRLKLKRRVHFEFEVLP